MTSGSGVSGAAGWPTRQQRTELLERAHLNVMNLDPADIEYDFFTDVPKRSPSQSVLEAQLRAMRETVRAPEIDALAEEIYGPAHYCFATRGRTAEKALAPALGLAAPRVLTSGLFPSVLGALGRIDASVEVMPAEHLRPGYSDLDLRWTAAQLETGDFRLVYVEAANNAIGGWPLSLENVQGLRQLCDKHGAMLIIDATRLLCNCALLGEQDIVGAAREFTALADAFTVSCAKESQIPHGALVGVRDLELSRRVFQNLFSQGTDLESIDTQVMLAAGLETCRDPSALTGRVKQAKRLAAELRGHGVDVVEPVGGHAAYVRLKPGVLGGASRPEMRSLQAVLYLAGGVRAWPSPSAALGADLLRLALPIGRFGDGELDRGAAAVARALEEIDRGVPPLIEIEGAGRHAIWAHFRRG